MNRKWSFHDGFNACLSAHRTPARLVKVKEEVCLALGGIFPRHTKYIQPPDEEPRFSEGWDIVF